MEHNKEFMKHVALKIYIFLKQQKPSYIAPKHHNTSSNWEQISI